LVLDIKLSVLNEIYELEEDIIKNNSFSELYIEIDDLLENCRKMIDPKFEKDKLIQIINQLWEEGHILRFISDNNIEKCKECNGNYKFSKILNREICICNNIKSVRSRTAEIIRLLSFNRNRFDLNSSIGTISYIKQFKTIPRREISTQELIHTLNEEIDVGITYIDGNNYRVDDYIKKSLKKSIKIVLNGYKKFANKNSTNNQLDDFYFSKFQVDAIKNYLYIKYFKRQIDKRQVPFPKRHYVLTAGVGSGKTFAFLTGIFIEILTKYQLESFSGISNLILYPRTTLVQDQYKVAKELLMHINSISNNELNGFKIKFLMEAGGKIKTIAESISNEPINSIPQALEICYRKSSYNIIFGTLESIKRRIYNPICNKKLIKNLTTIVFDEIHLLNGLQGTHAIYFSKRISALKSKFNANNKSNITFIGSSATIAEPEYFSAKIFGNLNPTTVGIITPNEMDLEKVGINHHVLLKALKGTHLMSVVTNMTSLVIHNRRNGLYREYQKQNLKDLNKTIGFADSLSLIGRWNFFMKDNEFMDIEHLNSDTPYPFFTWFYEPFRKHVKKGGNDIFPELKNICFDCKMGKLYKLEINLSNSDIEYLSKLRGSKSRITKSKFVNDLYFYFKKNNPIEIGTLNFCPYHQLGCCWWFSQDSEELSPHEELNEIYQFKSPIRTKIITSGTDEDYDEGMIKNIDDFFRDRNSHLFIYSEKKIRKLIDRVPRIRTFIYNTNSNLCLILASPKLEVGVDFGNVKEGIGHKAIRNLASYQQKMGRVGREINSDSMLINLLSYRPIDHHYFRNNFKLINTNYIEPIPIKEINLNIIKSELFMTVLDFISSEYNISNDGYRLFLLHRSSEIPLPKKIQGIFDYFNYPIGPGNSNLYNLKNYLKRIFPIESEIIEEAINNFFKILFIFDYNLSLICNVRNFADALHKLEPPNFSSDKKRIIKLYGNLIKSLKNLVFYLPIFNHLNKYDIYEKINQLGKIIEKNDDYNEFETQFQIIINEIDPFLILIRDKVNSLYRLNINSNSNENVREMVNQLRDLRSYITRLKEFLEDFKEIMTFEIREDNKIKQIYFILVNLSQMINELSIIAKSSDRYLKLSYFSDLFNTFSTLRAYYPYSFPQVLFENPTSKFTEIKIPIRNNDSKLKTIDASIVLYELLPGTWNYRFGRLLKSPSTEIISINNYNYIILNNIIEKYPSTELIQISEVRNNNFPIDLPIDLRQDNQILIFFPKTLELIYASEMPHVHIGKRLVIDNDESPYDNSDRTNKKLIKTIPTSIPRKWFEVKYTSSKTFIPKIKPYSPEITDMIQIPEDIELIMPNFISNIFENVYYSNDFHLTSYVWSIQRNYSDKDIPNINLYYQFNNEICFIGDKMKTDAIIFKIKLDQFNKLWEKIIIEKENNGVYASIYSQIVIQFLYWMINQIGHLNVFESTILLKVILNDYLDQYNCLKLDLIKLKENILSLNNDRIDNIISFLKNSGNSIKSSTEYKNAISILKEKIDNEIIVINENSIKDKAIDIYFHTLAHCILNSALRFSGVENQDLSYFYNIEKGEIYLFDMVEDGNGSCETIFKYLYIPEIERTISQISEKGRIIYPSGDFFTELEMEFQECCYSQASNISFDLAKYKLEIKDILPQIPKPFRKLIPDIKLNYKNGFIKIIKDIMDHFEDFIFADLYLVQKNPEFFMNLINFDDKLEKFESIIDVCVVACSECLIDTFNCIYGFIGSSERFNKYFLNILYSYLIEKDNKHYSIIDFSPNNYFNVKLLGKDENPDCKSIAYKYLDSNNIIRQKNLRILNTGKFRKPIYQIKGKCELNNNSNTIEILGYFLTKYEGAKIK